MNIHDRSSLLLVPSGYKDGKLYSQVPSSGDGDFAFTRGSNLAATRVGADGLIEKGRENLLLQSNTFSDIAWADLYTAYTRTGGQAGYDGSNDAWELSKASASNGYITQAAAATNSVYTFSIHAKSGSQNGLILFFGTPVLSVNLDTGENFGLNRSIINSSITSVGNGWWKIEFTFLASGTDISLKIMDADTNTNVAGSIYVQDAQLELGIAATDYIESGATTAKAGILENQPRLDYSGGASRASLLLEPQRTNIASSMLFPSLNGITYTISSTKIGDALPMQHFTKTSIGQYAGYIITGLSILAGDEYAFSMFFKPVSSDSGFHRIGMYFNGQNDLIYYDYARNGFFEDTSGTPLSSNKYVEEYANGVYRIISIQTAAASGNRIDVNVDSYYNTNSQFLCGYAQVEEGSYPTSYIPTYGASVTRSEDATSELALSPSYGSSNTWFFELKRIIDTSLLNQPISIIKNDSTGASNRFTIMSTSSGRLRVLLSDENGTTENLYSPDNSFDKGETIKAAVKITPSGCTLFVDGASAATSSSVGTITGIDAITYFKNAALNQFLVFPTALSDTDCELLTGTTYESFAAMAEALNYTVYE